MLKQKVQLEGSNSQCLGSVGHLSAAAALGDKVGTGKWNDVSEEGVDVAARVALTESGFVLPP